jgi:hypothetical protein
MECQCRTLALVKLSGANVEAGISLNLTTTTTPAWIVVGVGLANGCDQRTATGRARIDEILTGSTAANSANGIGWL